IDEKLKEMMTQIRLDTFIDPGLVQKVETIVREMMKEKGFQNAEVTHENKEQWFLSFISGRGTYQEIKFDEDAEKVLAYYRDHGYFKANVGVPELKVL